MSSSLRVDSAGSVFLGVRSIEVAVWATVPSGRFQVVVRLEVIDNFHPPS